MKKLTKHIFRTLTILFVSAITFVSCENPTQDPSDFEENSPAACFQRIIIPNEIITSNSIQNYAREAAPTQIIYNTNGKKFAETFLGSDSRGTVFLYMLKYDLHKIKAFRKLSGFGSKCDIQDFVDANGDYSTQTKKYICETWGIDFYNGYFKVENGTSGFDMGRLLVTKETDGVIVCVQKDAIGSFVHYITLTPNDFNSYDIDFYAIEVYPEQSATTSIYYERTKMLSNKTFEISKCGKTLEGANLFSTIVGNETTYKDDFSDTPDRIYSKITSDSLITYRHETGTNNFVQDYYTYTNLSNNQSCSLRTEGDNKTTYTFGKQNNGYAKTYIEVSTENNNTTTKYNLAALTSNSNDYVLEEITEGTQLEYTKNNDGSFSVTPDLSNGGGLFPYTWKKKDTGTTTSVNEVFNCEYRLNLYYTYPTEAFYVKSLKSLNPASENEMLKLKPEYEIDTENLKNNINTSKTTIDDMYNGDGEVGTYTKIAKLRTILDELNKEKNRLYTNEEITAAFANFQQQ